MSQKVELWLPKMDMKTEGIKLLFNRYRVSVGKMKNTGAGWW
jgi:hypothetical protein